MWCVHTQHLSSKILLCKYIYMCVFLLVGTGSFSSPTALPSSSLSASQPQPMAHLGSQGTNGRHGLVGSAPRISELEKMSPSDRQVPMGFCPAWRLVMNYIFLFTDCLRLHVDIWWWEKWLLFSWEKNVSDTNYANLQCLQVISHDIQVLKNLMAIPVWSQLEVQSNFWNPRGYLKFSIHLQALPFGPKVGVQGSPHHGTQIPVVEGLEGLFASRT